MKGAILEVFLVSAQGIDRPHILGHPGYHVIAECGSQIWRSKTSSGNHERIYWNQKLVFELPESDVEAVTHLKLRIVKEEHFSDGEFVGQTTIFLRGMIEEEKCREIHPSPFNVVVEDDTYKGDITVGLKFIPNSVVQMEGKQWLRKGKGLGHESIITSIWRVKWWSLLSSFTNHKHN